MAYQPIQLGNNIGVGAGLNSLTENVGDLSQFLQAQKAKKLEQERFDADKKRQAQFDFQQAYATAANLAEKGDIAGAQAMLAPYGASLQDLDADAAGLKKEMGIGQPQQPIVGGGAMPDGVENAQRGLAPQEAKGFDEAQAMIGGFDPLPAPGAIDPNQERAKKFMQMIGRAPADAMPVEPPPFGAQGPQAPAQGPMQPPPQQGPGIEQAMPQAPGGAPQDAQLNPILAGFGKDRERQQAMSRRLISMTDPSGRQVQLDPDARRNFQLQQQDQERERNVALAENAFAETEDPKVMFQNLLRSGLNPKQASDMVGEMVEKRQAAEAAARAKEEGRTHAAAEWDRQQKEREAAASRGRHEAARLGFGKTTIVQPNQEATGAGQVLTGLRSDLKEWTEQSGYERVAKELSASARTLKAIESGNPKLVQQAIFAYGKETAGVGSFTRDEQDAIINRTGGTWEQVVNAFNQAKEGVYSPETIKIFRDAMAIKAQSSRGELEQIHGSFQNKFRAGTAYQNVQQNMFDEEKTLFGRYGISPTPLGDGAGGVSYATPSMAKKGGARPAPSTAVPKETPADRKRRLHAAAAKME